MYGLCGKMKAHPGQRDVLLGHMLKSAENMRDVKGCYIYLIGTLPDDPDAIWITEVWANKADHDASLALEAIKAVIAVARPLIADMSEGFEFTPLGGAGLPAS